jgi:hypothetical protein
MCRWLTLSLRAIDSIFVNETSVHKLIQEFHGPFLTSLSLDLHIERLAEAYIVAVSDPKLTPSIGARIS